MPCCFGPTAYWNGPDLLRQRPVHTRALCEIWGPQPLLRWWVSLGRVIRGVEFRTVADQLLPVPGQIVPSTGHLQKLIALLPLRHLLGEDPAFFSVFSVF